MKDLTVRRPRTGRIHEAEMRALVARGKKKFKLDRLRRQERRELQLELVQEDMQNAIERNGWDIEDE